MDQHVTKRPIALSGRTVAALMAVNIVPLLATLPAVAAWIGGPGPAMVLLPVVTLPTVVLAAHCAPAVYRAQLVVAMFVSTVTILADFATLGSSMSSAIAVIGTLIFITVLIERSRAALRLHWRELRRAGATDPLTGTLNRRGAVVRLPQVTGQASRRREIVGIAAVDLDHFKRINDEFGHEAGDAAIREVCVLAQSAVGRDGLVVRSGGEELVLLTVGDPRAAVDRLVARLADRDAEPVITISVGVLRAKPIALQDADDFWAAVAVADLSLYRAKALGRDQVVDGGDFFAVHREPPEDDVSAEAGASGSDPPAASNPAAGAAGAPRDVDGFAEGLPAWRAAIERARQRTVDDATRKLYQLIVGWTMLVGIMTTADQLASGSMPAAQGWVMLPAGWLFGGTIIRWMRRLRTSWALTPVFILGSLFEVVVVFTVGVVSRPAALMLCLLVGLLVVLHWPRRAALAQAGLTAAASVGAVLAPGRPALPTMLIGAAIAICLITALAVVAAGRRREEGAEEELRRWALTDPLTGLGNRRALAEAGQRWESGYSAMIDVDHFKEINDRYGHGRGDEQLRTLAGGLSGAVAAADPQGRVFRIGGDEFVVAGPRGEPPGLAASIEHAVAALPLTVSVGIGTWTGRDSDGETGLWGALAAADRQMFGRKRTRAS